jgi:protein CpxP
MRSHRALTTLALLGALLLAGGAIPAAAQTTDPRPAHHGGRGGFFLRGLDLTDTQREQARDVLRAARPRIAPLADEARKAGRALFQAVTAPAPDESAIRAAAETVGRATGALAVERAKVGTELRALLTPEQQQKLDERLARMNQRMEQRGGPGRGMWRHGVQYQEGPLRQL